jgi:hypothetical protein
LELRGRRSIAKIRIIDGYRALREESARARRKTSTCVCVTPDAQLCFPANNQQCNNFYATGAFG